MINAALIGTGVFSRNVYSRILNDNARDVHLRTVWSRTEASANEFAEN